MQLLAHYQAQRENALLLTVFGKGPDEARLRELTLPPSLRVEVKGHSGYDELRDGYADADLLVFPTLADEWGLVVNEALAAGLPVLGSKYSQAVEELICEGQNGWVFDPTQDRDTLAAIERACSLGAEDLNRLRPHCRATVAERTPAWAAEKFVTALRSIWPVPTHTLTK